MSAFLVTTRGLYESSEVFGIFASFEDARAFIESDEQKPHGERAGSGDSYMADIEEWNGPKRIATFVRLPGTPLWENESTEETR